MPLDDENGENGGGLPLIPQGGQVPWQLMQPLQPPLQPPRQQPPQSPYYGYPPPPSSPPSSRRSLSPQSYKDPSPQMPSRDISPPRYQTMPPGPRVPSPWVRGPSPPLWQAWDDWTPYQRWAYGKATPEDDHLRKTDPDTFWPDMLIGDQFLTSEQHADHRECMGIPPIPVG